MIVYVVCDAGMGSSALSASLLRKAFAKKRLDVRVKNVAVDMPMEEAHLIVTHENFKSRITKRYPDKALFCLQDFLNKEVLEKVVEYMEGMKKEVLIKENIRIYSEKRTSDEAIRHVGEALHQSGYVEASYIDGMLERDHSLSVYMGNGISLPHGEYEYKQAILHSGIVIDVYPNGIDWHGETVYLVIGLAGIGEDHMQILSNIATVFGEMEEVEKVIKNQDADEIYRLLTESEYA